MSKKEVSPNLKHYDYENKRSKNKASSQPDYC